MASSSPRRRRRRWLSLGWIPTLWIRPRHNQHTVWCKPRGFLREPSRCIQRGDRGAMAKGAGDAGENPLVPNAKLKQMYTAMLEARMLEEAVKKKAHRTARTRRIA